MSIFCIVKHIEGYFPYIIYVHQGAKKGTWM